MCDDDDLSIEEKNLAPGREQRVLKGKDPCTRWEELAKL